MRTSFQFQPGRALGVWGNGRAERRIFPGPWCLAAQKDTAEASRKITGSWQKQARITLWMNSWVEAASLLQGQGLF